MTKQLLTTFFICLSLAYISVAQGTDNLEPTGMPGDDFSLEGALELFQKSETPENFERLLNTENNFVNNLDLNNDGESDYIRIHSIHDKDLQLFILQIPVSENENQDIAVIQLEKTALENAQIQIVGDAEIFGEEIIVEPIVIKDKAAKESKGGDNFLSTDDALVVVNVWSWPCVRYVYKPTYKPWISPWRWAVYPSWWLPWRPLSWNNWHPLKLRYKRSAFKVVVKKRSLRAPTIYNPVRMSSVTVNKRYAGAKSNYTISRSTTKVKGSGGNSVTKKTTKVKKNDKTKTQKTTVRKSRRGGN